jgi:hypothetical protein
MGSGFDLLLDILDRDGPKTYRELQAYPKDQKVDKNILTRAVSRDLVDFAFIIEGKATESFKAVRLYYTDAKQLNSRKGVLVPLAQLKETEENMIRDYVKSFDGKVILLGNAQAELWFELDGDSEICVRRKDLLRSLGRERGIEVRNGYEESIAPKGSMRWWDSHRNQVVSEIGKTLSHPLASFNFPNYEEYTAPISKWPLLQPGCCLGSILLPDLIETSEAEDLSASFKSLRHLEDIQQLETKLHHAVLDCNKGLELTRRAWTSLNDFVAQIDSAAAANSKDIQVVKTRNRTACFLYVNICASANLARLFVGGYKDFQALNVPHVGCSIIKKMLGSKTDEIDLTRNLRAKRSELTEVIGQSIEAFDVSDRQLDECFEKLRNTSRQLTEKGLTGRCETCRIVRPAPEVIWPRP